MERVENAFAYQLEQDRNAYKLEKLVEINNQLTEQPIKSYGLRGFIRDFNLAILQFLVINRFINKDNKALEAGYKACDDSSCSEVTNTSTEAEEAVVISHYSE